MFDEPRYCNYCNTRHELDRLEAVAVLASPAVVALAFDCLCGNLDLVLFAATDLMEHYPDLLEWDFGLGDMEKKRFLEDLDRYGNDE